MRKEAGRQISIAGGDGTLGLTANGTNGIKAHTEAGNGVGRRSLLITRLRARASKRARAGATPGINADASQHSKRNFAKGEALSQGKRDHSKCISPILSALNE